MGGGNRGVARGKQSTFGRRLRGARLSAPVMNEALISLKGANEVLRGKGDEASWQLLGGKRRVLRVVGKSGRAKSQSRRCCVG